MNKKIHDIDLFFRSSLEFHQVAPSPSVGKRLIASLDKRDAEAKRFRLWKRSAIFLLFLLLAIGLYEAGIINTRSKSSAKSQVHITPDKQVTKKNILDEDTVGPENKYIIQIPHEDNPVDKIIGNDDYAAVDRKSDYTVALTPNEYNYPVNGGKAYLSDNKIQEGAMEKEIQAFTLLPRSKPYQSIFRKPSYPQLESNVSLPGLDLTYNQNKNRIGFRPHWLIGAVFAYEAAGYKLDSDLPNEISSIKHREVHEPSYSGGVLVTRQVTFKWGLQSGLLYSKTDIGIGPQKLYAFLDPVGDVAYKYVTSSGYAYIKPKTGAPPSFGDSVLATEGKHTLRCITVPLTVKYSVRKNNFSFVPGLGIEGNFVTGTRVETEIESPSNSELVFVNKLHGAKSFYWSVSADAELRYHLNKKTMLSFRPSFHHSISPITENNIVETFPYSFRWGAGLTFKL